jgi:YHS domain-containing protein
VNKFLRLCAVPLLALTLPLAGCRSSDHVDHESGEAAHGAHESAAPGGDSAGAYEGLSAADRAQAKAQGTCPVSGEPLDSMGTPIKVIHGDKTIFLCCKGCEKKFHRNAEAYIAKVEKRSK